MNAESSMSSSRVRLEEFKSRAKRSLTESLEGIWKVNTFIVSDINSTVRTTQMTCGHHHRYY